MDTIDKIYMMVTKVLCDLLNDTDDIEVINNIISDLNNIKNSYNNKNYNSIVEYYKIFC